MRKLLVVLLGLFVFCTITNAQTTSSITKSYTAPSPISIDGCGVNCFTLPGLTLDWPDVPSGSHLFDVDVSVTWHKTDGTCTTPAAGCAFHNEVSFAIASPSTTVILANPGTWSGCIDAPTVTTTFNQGAPVVTGAEPITSTIGPNGGNLNALNGLLNLQIGTWNLLAGDNGGADPLCISSYSVTWTFYQEPPTLTCPSNVTVSNNTGLCSATVNYGLPLGSDNCGTDGLPPSISLSSGLGSGAVFPVGTTTEVYTMTGDCGEVLTCNLDVTVQDNEAPNAVCNDLTIQLDNSGNADITAAQVDVGSTDNCGIASSSINPFHFDCASLGEQSVALSIVDIHGNTSGCNAIVLVEDDLPPTITCQDVTIELNASGTGQGNVFLNGALILQSDNCGVVGGVGVTGPNPSCNTIGSVSRTIIQDDASGNEGTCTFTQTTVDLLAPTALCRNITIQLDAAGNASHTAIDIDDGSSDNCGIVYAASPTSYTCANIGANTSTLTVTDGTGNTASCTATVTVEDNVSPVAVCLSSFNINIGLSGSVTLDPGAVAFFGSGSSDACGISSYAVDQATWTCADVGSQSLTLTVTDVNGNSASCTETISVNDASTPVAVCQDVTVQLDASGNGAITVSDIDNGSSDNCGIAGGSLDVSTFTCADVGLANSVTLTVTDINGLISLCSANVTVEDNVAPTATCQDITVQLDAAGSVILTAADVNNGSNDACGAVNLVLNDDGFLEFTCANVGGNQVFIGVEDVNGNMSSCSATVTVQDNVVPTAICSDFTVQLNAGGFGNITPADVDGGSNDACGIDNLSVSPNSFTCAFVGSNPVTLTATDANGNVSTCSATVSVEDNVAPVANCQDLTIQLEASGSAGITAAQVDNGSNDNCGIASLSIDNSSFDCSNIVVVSSGADELFISEYIEGSSLNKCIEIYNGTGASVDLGAGGYQLKFYFNGSPSAGTTISLSGTIADGDVHVVCDDGAAAAFLAQADQTSTSSFYNGDDAVELSKAGTAIDILGMIDEDPGSSWNQGGNSTANRTLVRNADVLSGNTDNASGFPALGTEWTGFASNTVANLGSHTVSASASPTTTTLTVTDVNGNASTCTANITVEDNVPPVAICNDLTIQLDASGSASIGATNVDGGTNDACGIESLSINKGSFGCSDIVGSGPSVWINEFHYDNAGSDAGEFFEVAGFAGTDLTGYSVVLYNGSNGLSYFTSAAPAATLTDDGGGIGVWTVFHAGIQNGSPDGIALVGPSGVIEFLNYEGSTITANNGPAAGMTSTNIGVSESSSTPIGFSLQRLGGAGSPFIGPVAASPGAPNAGQAVASGSGVEVVLTAVDVNGNSSECTASITVEDNVAPSALCQDVTVQLDPSGQATLVPGDVDAGSSDACGIASLDVNGFPSVLFVCANVGQANQISLNVEDNNGNSASCISNVTVEDNVAPDAICQDLTIQLNANGTGSLTPSDVNDGSSDACGIASLYFDNTSFDCSNVGINTASLTVTDVNGNSSSCISQVTVEDNVAPIAICQDLTVSLDGSGSASVTAGDVDNGSNDACGVASLSINNSSFGCGNLGANAGSLTVTDNNGNASTCNYSVLIEDNEAPVVVCPPNINVFTDPGLCSAVIDGSLTAPLSTSDNCATDLKWDLSGNPYGLFSAYAGSGTGNAGTQTIYGGSAEIIYTLSDESGNSSTCSFTITVDDNEPPVVTCPSNIVVDTDPGACSAIVVYAVGLTENCPIFNFPPLNAPEQTGGIASGSAFPQGVTSNAFSFTDVQGNNSACTFTVTVNDNEAPNAICQDVTVTLDATGNASITAGDVDGGSSDNCGIGNLSLDNSGFTCGEIGDNPVALTVTDIHGNASSCNANVHVIGFVPGVTITEDVLPVFCQGGTIVLTANSDIDVQFYSWSTGETTQDIQVNEDGIYTVTVTSLTGCETTVSYEITGFDGGSILSSYTIIGTKEVHLHGNNVVYTGGVGVVDPDKKAKIHEETVVHTFVQAAEVDINGGSSVAEVILEPADAPLPPFYTNPYDSDNDVKVEDGEIVTLTDCVYDKLEIKKNAIVTLDCSNIFIHEFKLADNVTILFTGSTNMFIDKKVDMKKEMTFNPTAEHVVMYVDDKVEVKENSTVVASIYASKDIHAHGKENKPISMTGLFIGEKIHGDKYVSWNWNTICNPAPLPDFPEVCYECKGGATLIEMVYNGSIPVFVEVTGKHGDPVYYSGIVNPGDVISVTGDGPDGKLDKNTEIYVDGVLQSEVHTSGSQPLGPGLVLGDFTVTYTECKESDGPICPVDLSRVVAPNVDVAAIISVIESGSYPNPFTDMAIIEFQLPEKGETVLQIVSLSGEVIQSVDYGTLDANTKYSQEFMPDNGLASGTYIYRIISGKHIVTGKMMYLK